MTVIAVQGIEDRSQIFALHGAAFGGDVEAKLVERLEADGVVVLSLVAREDDRVTGHILFSSLDVDIDGRNVRSVSLAPMAVLPDLQRRGIGSQLVRRGLQLLPEASTAAVFVLGHREFYPRFGFSPELAARFQSPFQGNEHFMALELTPGALSGSPGSVRYPEAFGL